MDIEKNNSSQYLKRLYDNKEQKQAFHQDFFDDPIKWQNKARKVFYSKLGLKKIEDSISNFKPEVHLGEIKDLGLYTRQECFIMTEPDVKIPFWLLKPKSEGPWPLGIFPHGHSSRGHDTSAGVYHDKAHRNKSLSEDRDVAVQAVKRNIMAIAPATRGMAGFIIPDHHGRHGNSNCRSHLMHALYAGRTAMGERVWDMKQILNWSLKLPEVDEDNVLMMGNSGGGMVSIFTAGCDKRIDITVPSCSFTSTISESGYIFHCDCNMVPGLLELGGLSGIAGLIAPRYLLAVNGINDTLHTQTAINRAIQYVQKIYDEFEVSDRFEHRWGDYGHRFYKKLMWPFIMNIFKND